MSETIWKFPLTEAWRTTLQLPVDATPLTVQLQRGHPMLWVRLNPDERREAWAFYLYPTGGTMFNPSETYLATVQVAGGDYLFHVFYVRPTAEATLLAEVARLQAQVARATEGLQSIRQDAIAGRVEWVELAASYTLKDIERMGQENAKEA